ncbi:MAG: SIMPL domain-containing protein [Chlamydiales bacterium]|nr:SIMPL domain-containing protein [Chlamydiales bacterium]
MKRLAIALTLLLAPLSADEDLHNYRILSVVGQGKTKVMATISDVELGVEVQGKTAQEVQRALAQQIRPVIDMLKKEKVEKLQTGSINITPQWSTGSPAVVVGYTGFNSISFSAPVDKAGALIDASIKAGANRLQNLVQRPDDEILRNAHDTAITDAIQDAQAQANAALAALGLKQRLIARVTVAPFNGSGPYYHYAYREMSMNAAAAKTEVMPQEQNITSTVTLEIEYN